MASAACIAAEEAFWSYGYSSQSDRAAFLRAIADEIEARGDAITAQGVKETGLPEARLQGERGRTTGQLRLFADHIETGEYLDRRNNAALPDRAPLPRPDLRVMQRPIGPVVIFGASNFPLAFSTAGGDTAAALSAGCPVVVRGHSAHPGVSDLVAQAIDAARAICGLHPGVFSQIQEGGNEIGAALVQHPLVRAVGFTGSLRGGRALFDLCTSRSGPIPFYGELGSVNPMFLLPDALEKRAGEIAAGWVGSLTLGAGQFCTNPGVVVVIGGEAADTFQKAAAEAVENVGAQAMLTKEIALAYRDGRNRVAAALGGGLEEASTDDLRTATPYLFVTPARDFLAKAELHDEVFGPLGLIVVAQDFDEMLAVARSIEGQLTYSLHLQDADTYLAKTLLAIFERKAGRVLANGFPTGVEVCDAMVHGGPYPASTNFGATSVGTLAIRRFLRPVCYQGLPETLLPTDLR
ncbi:dehydrogenase [Roseobacter cerasinus]|uniref:Dehydrogenase n=2 Tax=Roseobacter cerasinus TaxID=2602289 RepID=A0A640VPL3_9RHOB|nr:dehydrogenase [Roseobacter cerasinus]